MRRIALMSWCLILAVTAGGGVWAAQRVGHHLAARSHAVRTVPNVTDLSSDSDAPLATGRVVAVDSREGRVTIAQQGIERFHVDPGTRVFHVPDSSLLSGLTPGDKVRFDVERAGKRYSITRLENTN